MAEGFPWLPHTATWQPKKDAVRGGANDGKENSLTPGAELSVFIEPKSDRWVVERYGVELDRQPFLLILSYEDGGKLSKGDILTYNGEPLEVAMNCELHNYGDGFTHAETMLWGKKTGGRG